MTLHEPELDRLLKRIPVDQVLIDLVHIVKMMCSDQDADEIIEYLCTGKREGWGESNILWAHDWLPDLVKRWEEGKYDRRR